MTVSEHLIDFARIDTLFRHLGLNLDAAECHGALCGLLCATDAVKGSAWVNQVLAGRLDLPEQEAPPVQSGAGDEDHTLLLILYKDTAGQLDDPEYGFALLLPDDDQPLPQRVEALSHWCQGFLLGLGLGGIKDRSGLPGDTHEVMQDFVEISRLSPGEPGAGNEDETAFAEVVEYVRMAVLLVYEELRPLRAARPADAPVH
jgi:yecA family protein